MLNVPTDPVLAVGRVSHFEGRAEKGQRTSDGRERWPRDWMGRGSGPFVNRVGAGKDLWGDGVRMGE